MSAARWSEAPESRHLEELLAAIARARLTVFDFDGTLVDSNPIKWRAFEDCFRDVGPRRDDVLAYCRSHDHVPRREKFRYIYTELLQQVLTPEIEARLAARFAAATTGPIIRAPEIPGASACLALARAHGPIALLSNTPQETLEDILRGRGWTSWFDAIQGAPVRKAEWLAAAGASRGIPMSALLYVGDTVEDAESAARAGCAFVAVGGGPVAERSAYAIPDFNSLVEAWTARAGALSR